VLTKRLKLAPHERRVLRKMARSRKIKAGDARRAKVILRLAKGESYQRIMLLEGCGSEFITRWRKRFEAERLGGLYARHRGRIVSLFGIFRVIFMLRKRLVFRRRREFECGNYGRIENLWHWL
jgi:Helix-turn-helix domain